VSLIVETSHASGRNILLGIAQYTREHGPWSIYHEFRNTDRVFPAWLQGWRGDGIIARVENRRIAKTLRGLRVPVVDVLGMVEDAGFPIVHPDDARMSRIAADHLLERGYRSFGFCGVKVYNWSARRRDAFLTAVREEGYPCAVHEYTPKPSGEWSWERDLKEIGAWLRDLRKPAGIMSCNDQHGRLVLEACRAAGFAVPDEVAVVGVDNDEPLCEVCEPPLSSVIPDDRGVGYEAAALLDTLMAGRSKGGESIWLPPRGVRIRLSSDTLAIMDKAIALAVAFIRENACRGISVQDVVDHAHVSRSLLQRRFRVALGRSVHDEIIKVRIDHAQFLLEESDMTIAMVAEKAGFNHQEYMGAVFKKTLGLTPLQYRRANRRP
jgi:LacI family transcriptional regulator